MKKNIRVKVRDGTGEKLLGEGVYVGDVQAYAVLMPDGSLQSCLDAEQPPNPKDFPDGELVSLGSNPKIILDNGKVVYGCQVWWSPVDEVDDDDDDDDLPWSPAGLGRMAALLIEEAGGDVSKGGLAAAAIAIMLRGALHGFECSGESVIEGHWVLRVRPRKGEPSSVEETKDERLLGRKVAGTATILKNKLHELVQPGQDPLSGCLNIMLTVLGEKELRLLVKAADGEKDWDVEFTRGEAA